LWFYFLFFVFLSNFKFYFSLFPIFVFFISSYFWFFQFLYYPFFSYFFCIFRIFFVFFAFFLFSYFLGFWRSNWSIIGSNWFHPGRSYSCRFPIWRAKEKTRKIEKRRQKEGFKKRIALTVHCCRVRIFIFITNLLTQIFRPKLNFWSKFKRLVKTSIFGQNFNFWSKFKLLVKILIIMILFKFMFSNFLFSLTIKLNFNLFLL